MKLRIRFIFFILASAFLYVTVVIHSSRVAYALESGWNITSPGSVSFPPVSWSLSTQTNTVTFGTVIEVTNTGTTTQGFTAQVTSNELIHSTDSTLFMGYTRLAIQTGAVTTTQSVGISAPINGIYATFSGSLATSDPVTFMSADAREREAGSWQITPTLQLTIPAKQRAGTYNATLTFTLS